MLLEINCNCSLFLLEYTLNYDDCDIVYIINREREREGGKDGWRAGGREGCLGLLFRIGVWRFGFYVLWVLLRIAAF